MSGVFSAAVSGRSARIPGDFSEKNAERKIFNYFAAAWNRDGLTLRMAGKLLDTAPADRHLLILSSEFCRICPSANQLQPLPSKTDKNFLEIFMNANLSSKNRSVQPEIQLCAPVCFDGANIEFFFVEDVVTSSGFDCSNPAPQGIFL